MKWFRKRKGFTLLELMIVVIIVGILASLALPRFVRARKTARSAEALHNLGMLRSSMMRYYLAHDLYTSAVGDLDTDDPNALANRYFNYAVAAPGATDAFDVTASYIPDAGASSIVISEGGVIARTGF